MDKKLRFKDRIKVLTSGKIDEKSFFSGRTSTVLYSGLLPFRMLEANADNYIKEGYEKNDDLYSVIEYITTLAADLGRYYELTKPDGTTEEVSLPEFDKLLDRPQPGVNYRQFIKQAIGFRLLTGDGFVYAPRLENGQNKGKTKSLQVLPSQFMKVEKAERDFTSNEKRYYFQYSGKQYEINQSDIGHFMAASYSWENDANLRGTSPLHAGSMRLSSSNDALMSKAVRFQNGGADGIVGTKNTDAGTQEVSAMKSQYHDQYSGPRNAGKVIWTNLDVTYQRFGLSPVDLQILQSMQMDLQAFCRMYRIDAKLLDPNAPTTYNNMIEAKASAYTMAVIPILREFFDMLNEWLLPAYTGGQNIRIKVDYSKIPELQKDMSKMGDALQKIKWAISINEARYMLDLEPYDDPEADIPEGIKADPGFSIPPPQV